jgi:hypothetical protein
MSRSRRSFPPETLAALRSMTPQQTLDRLGLGWKRDPDFLPTKNPATTRLYVTVGAGVVELLATGVRWYDVRERKGGGGGIDLTMHLLHLPFVDAVKRLR